MIIGIDASRAFKRNKTGVEWYAYEVIRQMVKSAPKNARFALYCDKIFGNRDSIPMEECYPYFKYLRWPFKYLWTQGRLSLEMLFHPPDVLFVPASAMPIIHPKNTIAAVHDVGFMKFPEAYGKWQRRYLKWSARFAARHAKKIITISEFSKREIVKYFGADKKKIAVIPLACDKQKFRVINDQQKINSVLRKYKISRPYILFVGRLEKKKNIAGLVKSFLRENKRSRCKLVLAGAKGYGWAEAGELIRKNNIQNDVIIAGYVSDEDLPYLYNGAELFILPSLYEGFGMPILEAMACGVPVIASNTTSCPEVAGRAAVLVNPNDSQRLAEKMAEILGDSEMRDRLRGRGLERVKEFSWEKCGRETLDIIRNLFI